MHVCVVFFFFPCKCVNQVCSECESLRGCVCVCAPKCLRQMWICVCVCARARKCLRQMSATACLEPTAGVAELCKL